MKCAKKGDASEASEQNYKTDCGGGLVSVPRYFVHSCRLSSRAPLTEGLEQATSVTYGKHSFKYLGPKLWKLLPEELRNISSIQTLKNKYEK